MRQLPLRPLCLGLAAVAIGAGAGFAFLQMFSADAAAPAASAPTLPAAGSWPPIERQPAPAREGTPAPGMIYSAPSPPPAPVSERPKPATSGKKYAPPPRSKLATRIPDVSIDADALEEAIADGGVPLRIGRWHLRW